MKLVIMHYVLIKQMNILYQLLVIQRSSLGLYFEQKSKLSLFNTVCGPKEPSELGVVLPHEQPMCDFTGLFQDPGPGFGSGESLANLNMQMSNLGKIRQYPYVNLMSV